MQREAAHEINIAFGQDYTTEHTIHLWFETFRSSDTDLNDEEHGHRPPAIDNDQLRCLVETTLRIIVREIA
jgi:transposase